MSSFERYPRGPSPNTVTFERRSIPGSKLPLRLARGVDPFVARAHPDDARALLEDLHAGETRGRRLRPLCSTSPASHRVNLASDTTLFPWLDMTGGI